MAAHRAEGIDPRRAHPVMSEYYVAVAHARIHQAVRAAPSERKLALRRLKTAVTDLRAAARYPVLKAHLFLAEGVYAWLSGSTKRAQGKLAEAEQLADEETCVWVRFGVERVRAHMLRESGRGQGSRDWARAAAHIARDHGAVQWARWIHEELGVYVATTAGRQGTRSTSMSTSRAQLKALLNVLRVGAQQLDLEEQARMLVDELLASAEADRALLHFDADGRRTQSLTVGRARDGTAWPGSGARTQQLIERAHETGLITTIDARDEHGHPDSDEIRAVAVPLWLRERPAGAVCLERDPTRPPFSTDELDILVALSYQVPLALELTRALREHARLEDALRQSQKMEAVGRLVGGIAHDFNNMMMVVVSSVDILLQREDIHPDVREELQLLEAAIERAATLTRQLLTFARRQPRHAEPLDASEVIAELVPMLRRLIPQHIDVNAELSPEALRVHVDRGFFEQAIVNLAVNARDAMPDGGALTLRTERATLDEEAVRARPGLLPGPHVRITIVDTGVGMPRDVRESAFDPFFTTKGRGRGTGLGLSMVHGFVDQSAGSIEIESEPGLGTLFRIHLPALPSTESDGSVEASSLEVSAIQMRATEARATEVSAIQMRATEARATEVSATAARAIQAGDSQASQPEPSESERSESERSESEPSVPGAPSRNDSSRTTILVVEDELRIREVLQRVLSDEGYDVLISGVPEQALDMVGRPDGHVDLVITDVLMPGMSGPELAREIRVRAPAVKLLYMSGYAGGELQDLGSLETIPFLEKPFRTEALLTIVRDLLAQ